MLSWRRRPVITRRENTLLVIPDTGRLWNRFAQYLSRRAVAARLTAVPALKAQIKNEKKND